MTWRRRKMHFQCKSLFFFFLQTFDCMTRNALPTISKPTLTINPKLFRNFYKKNSEMIIKLPFRLCHSRPFWNSFWKVTSVETIVWTNFILIFTVEFVTLKPSSHPLSFPFTVDEGETKEGRSCQTICPMSGSQLAQTTLANRCCLTSSITNWNWRSKVIWSNLNNLILQKNKTYFIP